MRTVTNKEFEEALECKDYEFIMYSAASRYSKSIPPEDIESCKLTGLWMALSHYDYKNRRSKFTSYLFNRVCWECMNYITRRNKHESRFKNISVEEGFYNEDKDIEEVVESISPDLVKVIKQRFFQNMTFKEIGIANGYSRGKADKQVKKGIKEIKDILIN